MSSSLSSESSFPFFFFRFPFGLLSSSLSSVSSFFLLFLLRFFFPVSSFPFPFLFFAFFLPLSLSLSLSLSSSARRRRRRSRKKAAPATSATTPVSTPATTGTLIPAGAGVGGSVGASNIDQSKSSAPRSRSAGPATTTSSILASRETACPVTARGRRRSVEVRVPWRDGADGAAQRTEEGKGDSARSRRRSGGAGAQIVLPILLYKIICIPLRKT
mmetsp:Transcript_43809/g.85963  ORF Transcript_43809/g.85963 Transcript_43809/m.85963 type:complete len:216 (+) Transcript_43809:873-1520(+)